jgi:glycosyltransferase 2 family protein
VLTALIWATEAMRLFLVVEALGFPAVHLGISGAFFVALTGSLLTAVPLTPAGIGVVEAGVVFVLTVVYQIDQSQALAIVLVDRVISVLSIIGFGSIAYWISPKRRGMGVRPRGAGAPEPA